MDATQSPERGDRNGTHNRLGSVVPELVYETRKRNIGCVEIYAPYFYQVKVNPKVNVNFWGYLDGEAIPVSASIHSHYMTFESTILMGRVVNRNHTVVPADEGAYVVYGVERQKAPEGHWMFRTYKKDGKVDIYNTVERTYEPGDRYYQYYSWYHSNVLVSPTITYVEHDLESTQPSVESLVTVNDPTDYSTDFTTRAPKSEEELDLAWKTIEKFLGLLTN